MTKDAEGKPRRGNRPCRFPRPHSRGDGSLFPFFAKDQPTETSPLERFALLLARVFPALRNTLLVLLTAAGTLVKTLPAQSVQTGPATSSAVSSISASSAQALSGRARLLPEPREYSAAGTIVLRYGVRVSSGSPRSGAAAEDRFAAQELRSWLRERGIAAPSDSSAFHIELLRTSSPEAQRLLSLAHIHFEPAMHEEGYAVIPTGLQPEGRVRASQGTAGAAVIADTSAGLFYGAQTVKQMVSGLGPGAVFNNAVIRDWPAMRYRGLSDDLSRGPMPTLEFAKRQIRTLAEYKINVFSPYFESSLIYRSTPLSAIRGETLSTDEMRAIALYAEQYHITIVPEQEAFGHLHQLLKYEQYSGIAETPLGSVLAPGERGSLDLIADWFGELTEVFPGPFVHIGADETFALGEGRTRSAVQAQGLGAVYVDFLRRIHDRLAPDHKRLLFWGDIAANDPGRLEQIPKDMIAVAWAYSLPPHGYESLIKPYTDAGIETWVAPGVSNWNRVFPDYSLALKNVQDLVRAGETAHSSGVLNTVWNDDGEALFFASWYGALWGAAAGWQPDAGDLSSFENSYGLVFHGDLTGKVDAAERELMTANQLLTDARFKETTNVLYWADPWSKEGRAMDKEMRPLIPMLRLHAEAAITLLAQARAAGPLRENETIDAIELGARKLDFIGEKFETADEIASVYQEAYARKDQQQSFRAVFNLLRTLTGPGGLCQDLRNGYTAQRAAYSALWLAEYRPAWLENILPRYELAAQLWIQRGDSFQAALREWTNDRTLPSPADMGIPAGSLPGAAH